MAEATTRPELINLNEDVAREYRTLVTYAVPVFTHAFPVVAPKPVKLSDDATDRLRADLQNGNARPEPPGAPTLPPDDPNAPRVDREPDIDPPPTDPPLEAPAETPGINEPPAPRRASAHLR